ncbi:MAG: hypothetical protein VB140_08040 [Burkholderia sp.]|nr:MAG: hypothetical protein E5299_01532 [Burkholderia gladioli]
MPTEPSGTLPLLVPPRVGDNRSVDLERIVAFKPDLNVVWGVIS